MVRVEKKGSGGGRRRRKEGRNTEKMIYALQKEGEKGGRLKSDFVMELQCG